MRKLILFLLLLFVGVFTSACVNTYAVKQLNDIAIEYLNQGDVQSAISRLEASVDLDGNVYESRYNLAVAYMNTGQCQKAIENITVAKSLKKTEEPIIYYTLGAANGCLAAEVYEFTNKDGEKEKVKFDNRNSEIQAAERYIKYLEESNRNFDSYTKLEPNANDTKDVLEIIAQNKIKIGDKKSFIESK